MLNSFDFEIMKAVGDVGEDTSAHSFLSGAKEVLLLGPLNLLLLCLPLSLVSDWIGWSELATFSLALLALAPVAERLGFVTEQLAIHTNETIGGLLNATFGNATELIVAITALNKGLFRLVQLSLLGSILSNLLLVLGCSFFFGGMWHKTQYFGKISSQVNSTLLMVGTAGVLLPTVLTLSKQETRVGELVFSRWASLLLFISYFAFLYFQVSVWYCVCVSCACCIVGVVCSCSAAVIWCCSDSSFGGHSLRVLLRFTADLPQGGLRREGRLQCFIEWPQ